MEDAQAFAPGVGGNVLVIGANTEPPRADDEIFTFQGEDGTTYFFNASLLRRMSKDGRALGRPDTIGFDAGSVEHIIKNNGVEMSRIRRLRTRPDIFMQPPLVADFPDGTSVVIDGNHRIVLLWMMGHVDITTLRFAKNEWEKCLLDVPPEFAPVLL